MQKQSYKTHPLLAEMEATPMFVYFWFLNIHQTELKHGSIMWQKPVLTNCVDYNRLIPTY